MKPRWLTYATSTAAKPDPVGSSPYWLLHADYQTATRLGADIHETCRDGCEGGGWGDLD